jgi:soluble lytic murein transglycosylase-like protein
MTGCPLMMLLVFLAAGYAAQAQPAPIRQFETEWAQYYAREYSVPSEFVIAIIDVESRWQPYAISEKGAAGLMQLLPAAAYRFGVTNRFVVQENIRGGVAYLAYLVRQFGGDLRLAAAAYYAGEKRIQAVGLNCSDPAVYRYVMAVQRAYRRALLSRLNSPPVTRGGTNP